MLFMQITHSLSNLKAAKFVTQGPVEMWWVIWVYTFVNVRVLFSMLHRAPDKEHISNAKILISEPISMLWPLLESSLRDDSNKGHNIGIGSEIEEMLKDFF